MKSIKFYKILSIILLILNIVTLTIFFMHRPPGPPTPGEARLAEEIGLTGSKKKIVDALEIQHHKEKKSLITRNFRLQKQLYSTLGVEEKSAEILMEIRENRVRTDRMTYRFFSEVASHCDQNQRKKLDKIIEKGLRRITGVPGPPPKK
ncbi:MAG: hypothetical protein ACFHU9_08590 [Fluviicola sp.]